MTKFLPSDGSRSDHFDGYSSRIICQRRGLFRRHSGRQAHADNSKDYIAVRQ